MELVRGAFENKMSKVLTLRYINIQTRKRASQCYTCQHYFMVQRHGH